METVFLSSEFLKKGFIHLESLHSTLYCAQLEVHVFTVVGRYNEIRVIFIFKDIQRRVEANTY